MGQLRFSGGVRLGGSIQLNTFDGYLVDYSAIFNDNDSSYLGAYSPSVSESNIKAVTLSAWVKFSGTSSQVCLFSAGADTNNRIGLFLNTSQLLTLFEVRGGTGSTILQTTAAYRDPAAWYHIFMTIDTSDATADDRQRIWVNGEEVTDFDIRANFTQNEDQWWGRANVHEVGRYCISAANYFDGNMAQVIMVAGSAGDVNDFGEFNSRGVWVPTDYTGTYGDNGFRLEFDNSSDFGVDTSGNGNDFTATNFASTDQVTDTPTNNFCVFNPLVPTSNAVYSNGNLTTGESANSGINNMFGTFGLTSGKWHWEVTTGGSGSSGNGYGVGISKVLDGTTNSSSVVGFKLYDSAAGNFVNDADGGTSYGATYTSGDRITVELDIDNESMEFFKNGSSQGSIDLTGELLGYTWYPLVCDRTGVASIIYTANFGQKTFTDTPSGSAFKALSTDNLPTPTVDIGSNYYNTVLYTGTGSSQGITGVGFQPDFVIVKSRSASTSNYVYDAVRGAGNRILTDGTATETSISGLTSFDSDGFTVGTETGNNNNGATYVAQAWKANGSGSSNTDGTITSTVSVNQTAGFSIVEYTGNATAGATIGHGLGVTPDVIAIKPLEDATNWYCYYSDLGEGQRMGWNTTAAVTADTVYLNNTAPDASVFTVGSGAGSNYSGHNMVAYCWVEVEGFSSFGTYTGNGSTNGTFVYTGFRPAFVVAKKTSAATTNWNRADSVRSPYNVVDLNVDFDRSASEVTTDHMDFLSNGFKLRTRNASGATFVYMAFAEHPFKYANAR